jgi:hypothetical protein
MTTLGNLVTWTAEAVYLIGDALNAVAVHLLDRTVGE